MCAHGCQVTPATFVERTMLFPLNGLGIGPFCSHKKLWPHIAGRVHCVGLRRWGVTALLSVLEQTTQLPSCSFLIVQCHSCTFIGHFAIQKCFCWGFITILGKIESSPGVEREGFYKVTLKVSNSKSGPLFLGWCSPQKQGLAFLRLRLCTDILKASESLARNRNTRMYKCTCTQRVAMLPTFSKDSWTADEKILN